METLITPLMTFFLNHHPKMPSTNRDADEHELSIINHDIERDGSIRQFFLRAQKSD